jgi:predicted TPR repeat methyltransferase
MPADKYDLAGKPTTDTAEVMRVYDDFAPTYDDTLLKAWGYAAPVTAAAMLARYIPVESKVLDAGCGTGLTGSALHEAGFATVYGVDISQPSLQVASSKGLYKSLVRADLLKPLPFPDDTFDAAICVGVLSYISGDGLFQQLCRVTRAGGVIVLSHRTDLVASRSFVSLLQKLVTAGLWARVFESAPLPYLPTHPDFGDQIQAQYFVLRVS